MLDSLNKSKFAAKGKKREGEDKPAKILIVDDDAGLREVLSDILAQEGYTTKGVKTGKEAVEACEKEFFDISLIDIKLPDIDGTALLQLMEKFYPKMIKIVVTGYPSLENAVQSLNAGADGYIIKPFKPAKILEQIREQLEKHQIENIENLLKNTGLSTYEAKIYLSLALNGCSEVRKLSLSSGVPRTKAYAALKKLTQRGIITDVPGAKQKFSIVEPSEAFGTFVQSWKRELSEQEKSLVEFEKAISTLDLIHANRGSSQSDIMQKQDVWLIKGEEEITQRISGMLSAAKTSVCATTTEQGIVRFYRNFRRILDELSAKGIKIRINVPFGTTNSSFINELKCTYQIEDSLVTVPLFFLAVDNKELLVANLGADHVKHTSNKESGLFAQGENIVSFFNKQLEI